MEGSDRTVGSDGNKSQRWIMRSIVVVDVLVVVILCVVCVCVCLRASVYVLARHCFSQASLFQSGTCAASNAAAPTTAVNMRALGK